MGVLDADVIFVSLLPAMTAKMTTLVADCS